MPVLSCVTVANAATLAIKLGGETQSTRQLLKCRAVRTYKVGFVVQSSECLPGPSNRPQEEVLDYAKACKKTNPLALPIPAVVVAESCTMTVERFGELIKFGPLIRSLLELEDKGNRGIHLMEGL